MADVDHDLGAIKFIVVSLVLYSQDTILLKQFIVLSITPLSLIKFLLPICVLFSDLDR